MLGGISGVDVNDIVDGIMSYKKIGLERMNQKQKIYDYQKTASSSLKKMLDDLNNAFTGFKNLLNKNNYTATSNNEAVLSVGVNSDTLPIGNYNVTVSQLAKAQQITSQAYSSSTDALGLTSTLNIAVQGSAMAVTLSSTDSLESIQTAINNASDNPGVYASIIKATDVNGNDTYLLMLTATQTGKNFGLTLSGTALTDLDITHEMAPAQDAVLTFNGLNIQRSSNFISDLIDGLDMHLNGLAGSTIIDIGIDNTVAQEGLKTQMQAFIDKYNALMDTLSASKVDRYLKSNNYAFIQEQLQNMMGGMYGSQDTHYFYALGVTTAASSTKTNDEDVEYAITGKLDFDSTVFSQILSSNVSSVRAFFNDVSNGFASQWSNTILNLETETLYNSDAVINKEIAVLQDQMDREQTRLDATRTALMRQYVAVQEFVTHYEQMGRFLDMQLDALLGKKK